MNASAAPSSTGLVVHHGTRVERLLEHLVVSLRDRPPKDPFTPITIVVQSRGIERWLSQQIAQHLDADGAGIAANLRFPFPGRVVRELTRLVFPDHPEQDPWDPDRLVWPLLTLLTRHRQHPNIARLERYLAASDPQGTQVVDRRMWRFARQLADVLESYTLARPMMLRAWSLGEDLGPDLTPLEEAQRWQPWLWRSLVEELGVDPAHQLRQTIEAIGEGRVQLPPTLTDLRTFGISVVPGVQLDLVSALARRTRVELFVPIVSAKRWEDAGVAAATDGALPRAANPLITASGRVADDAALLFHDYATSVVDVDDAAGAATAGDDLLAWIQAGIREDLEPRAGRARVLAPDDRSVRIHRCYGQTRQAEALRDALLRLLAEDETLEPRDILVMTPDLATFAPLIEAAFVGSSSVPDLPVTVADRPVGANDPVVDSLLALLAITTTRATATSVLDLLGKEPVARRFGLGPDALEQASRWVVNTGIRWGFDREDRVYHGQPADRVHTWHAGIDRLLLGVAMADEDDRIIGDVTPFDHIEGDDAIVAGRLAEAITVIGSTVKSLRAPRDAAGWADALDQALDRCVAVEPGETWRLEDLRSQITEVLDGASAPEALALSIDALHALIDAAMQRPRASAGYETGAVTLCELVPMRSIPHRVVCLLGLDDQSFPRTDPRPGFHLLEHHDAVGDRDRRREDRALFLEAILAARQHLVITTNSWDVQTGQPHPPPVPLAELYETIDRIASPSPAPAHPDGDPQSATTTSEQVIIDHPLHPFSPAAFDRQRRDGPTSFDDDLRDASLQASTGDRSSLSLITHPLPEREGSQLQVIPLNRLQEAVTYPIRSLFRRRLGVDLNEDVTIVDDLEPLDLDGLHTAQLGREILVDGGRDGWSAAMVAGGTVPAGTPGTVLLRGIEEQVALIQDDLRAAANDVGIDPQHDLLRGGQTHHVEVVVGDRVIAGSIDRLYVVGDIHQHHVRLSARFARRNPAHLLALWVTHLVASAAGLGPLISIEVTRGRSRTSTHRWKLGPIAPEPAAGSESAHTAAGTLEADVAEEHLRQLLALYDLADREPVPLFPRASYSYLEKERGQAGLAAAAKDFAPEFGRGDRDEYVQAQYGPDVELEDILSDPRSRHRFETLTDQVWAPAYEADKRCDLTRSIAPPSPADPRAVTP